MTFHDFRGRLELLLDEAVRQGKISEVEVFRAFTDVMGQVQQSFERGETPMMEVMREANRGERTLAEVMFGKGRNA